MRYVLTLCFLLFMKLALAFDIIDDVATTFKSGDATAVGKYFSSTVELAIDNQERIYSSNQATLILKGFFTKHSPLSSKIIHKVASNKSYKFGVMLLTTSSGRYRISFELKEVSGKFIISQIRIEENKG